MLDRRTTQDRPAEERAGESILALVALDIALSAARWVVANSAAARADFPAPGLPALDRFAYQVRQVRNELTHFDERAFENPQSMIVADDLGVHTGNGFAVTFDSWIAWLDVLVSWARRRQSVVEATIDVAVAPAPLPRGRRRAYESDPVPMPGTVVFGRTHHPDSIVAISEPVTEFDPGEPVAVAARLISEHSGVIQMWVSRAENLVYVQMVNAGTGQSGVSTTLTGMTPGQYLVSLRDLPGRCLAIGVFTIRAERT